MPDIIFKGAGPRVTASEPFTSQRLQMVNYGDLVKALESVGNVFNVSTRRSSVVQNNPNIPDSISIEEWNSRTGTHPDGSPIQNNNSNRKTKETSSNNHIVRTGDTLWDIATRNGLTVQQLLDYNPEIKNRKNNLIMPGDVLYLKGNKISTKKGSSKRSSKESFTSADTYKVKKGDTLSSISRKTGISIKDLQSMNGILNNDRIYAGDILKLKGDKYYHSTPTIPQIEIKPIVDTSVPKIVINGINI